MSMVTHTQAQIRVGNNIDVCFVLFYFLGLYSIHCSVVLTSFLENPLYSHIS